MKYIKQFLFCMLLAGGCHVAAHACEMDAYQEMGVWEQVEMERDGGARGRGWWTCKHCHRTNYEGIWRCMYCGTERTTEKTEHGEEIR